jgi:sec-independent protein translocase protein TatC
VAQSSEKSMALMEHLSELTKRLKIVIIVLAATCSIGFLPADLQGYSDPFHQYKPLVSIMLQKMKHDFLPSNATLIASGLVDTLFVYMYLTLLVGIVLASPVIAYEIYAYIRPALYPNERKYIMSFIGAFVGLFTLGLAIAYFVIIPITFQILVWFITSAGAVPFIAIKDFYNWVFTLLLASGIFYTIPIFVVLLVQFGIISTKVLSGKTKIAIYIALEMIIWTFGPDPTPITATIIMVPFAVIFEVATFYARRIERKRSTTDTYAPPRARLGAVACRFCGGNVSSSFCVACGKSQV